MLLWIGLFAGGWLIGRLLPRWTLVVGPGLIVAWGVVAENRWSATNETAGLAFFVAVLLALILGAGEVAGASVRRHRRQRPTDSRPV